MVRVNGQFQPAVPAGVPGATGPQGAVGPQGPSGADGQATLIMGNFGASKVPADLPTTGLIPIDWDAPGVPAADMQLLVGHSLYYDAIDPLDPQAGHLFQFVTVASHPTGYLDIGLIRGPAGADSTIPGPAGPTGPQSDDIYVGPDDPVTTKPTAELWFDLDDNRILGPTNLPLAGLANQALIKRSDADGDVMWSSGIHTGEAFRKTLQGPWNGTGAGSKFDVTLETRRYLVLFSVSAMCSATGAKWIACSLDGSTTPLEYTRVWMNEINSHKMMSTGTAIIDVVAGPHTFAFGLNSSASGILSDQNDWGSITIIPLPPL